MMRTERSESLGTTEYSEKFFKIHLQDGKPV